MDDEQRINAEVGTPERPRIEKFDNSDGSNWTYRTIDLDKPKVLVAQFTSIGVHNAKGNAVLSISIHRGHKAAGVVHGLGSHEVMRLNEGEARWLIAEIAKRLP